MFLSQVTNYLSDILSLSEGPGKQRSFWEHDVAEEIQRHGNDMTYTIKTISQPEKVRTLHKHVYPCQPYITNRG